MFNKKNKNNIDEKTANEILRNVFEMCDAPATDVSVNNISSPGREAYKSDSRFIAVISLVIAVVIIIPLFFKSSSMLLSVDSASQRPLSISETELTEEYFALSFVGAYIDLDSTYAECEDGSIVAPIGYNKTENKILFPYFDSETNLYIYDINGKCLHLLFSPRK